MALLMKTTINKYYIKELWTYSQCCQALGGRRDIPEKPEFNMAFKNDKLSLVGIYHTDDGDVIYCCPKYISDDDVKAAGHDTLIADAIQKHMELICRTLDKLRAEGRNIPELAYDFDANTHNTEIRRINRYGLAKMLIQDYLDNGIYFKAEKQISSMGKGRVRWSTTIRKRKPIICNNMVVYTNLLRQTNYNNYDGLMTQIHMNVILQCLEYMQAMGQYTNIELPQADILYAADKMCDFVGYIRQQLAYVYTNRELDLFKALIAWCAESEYYKGRGCTTSFLDVWQWVNDYAWGNVPQSVINSTPPVYQIAGKRYCGTGDEEPDTISIIQYGEDGVGVAVFDSKYYVLKTPLGGADILYGLPPNHDIVKQVAYRQHLEDIIGRDGVEYANVFLLPYCKEYGERPDLYAFMGTVTSGDFRNLKQYFSFLKDKQPEVKYSEPVGVMILNPEALYQRYLDGKKVSSDEIRSIIKNYHIITQQSIDKGENK